VKPVVWSYERPMVDACVVGMLEALGLEAIEL
jgi:hypothetical protein